MRIEDIVTEMEVRIEVIKGLKRECKEGASSQSYAAFLEGAEVSLNSLMKWIVLNFDKEGRKDG